MNPSLGFQILKSEQRFRTTISWLNSYHSFSFGEHFDPTRQGFGFLKVINEDFVKAGQGFATHGHRNMEIVTYVVEGAIAHRDSLGSSSTIYPGESQMMSAGKGIRHSEYNPIADKDSHFIQIWILPDQQDVEPRYAQKRLLDFKGSDLYLIASRDGRDQSVAIHQDLEILSLHKPKAAGTVELPKYPADSKLQSIWIHNVSSRPPIRVFSKDSEVRLDSGDSLALISDESVKIEYQQGSEALVFLQRKLDF
jgi:redox-sensitive bicupin YhaK (pirin superfamily)